MRMLLTTLAGALALTLSQPALCQTDAARNADSGVEITDIITNVSKNTGKKFVVDPRVRTRVTVIGQNPANISYPELLTILHVYGFTAVESGGYVQVVPDSTARQLANTSGRTNGDMEFVSRVIELKSIPAPLLVPILRPLLPQNAHLASFGCRNSLLMVDTYANVKRIEAIVQQLDKGAPIQLEKCTVPGPPPPKEKEPAAS